MKDVRDYLARQERETLVRRMLDKAMEDARWRERLLMKVANIAIEPALIQEHSACKIKMIIILNLRLCQTR